jgi:nicotinamidase/pyrazinamidase
MTDAQPYAAGVFSTVKPLRSAASAIEESTMKDSIRPQPGDALIVVDVQNDFLPGGALGVPHGDEVVPVLNRYIERFDRLGLPIVATRDWHPADHCSFAARGGPWPPHCVAQTRGAQFSPALKLPVGTRVVSKATTPDDEAYSGFHGTQLDRDLRELNVKRVFIGGLATDYCVLNTVKDARKLGFDVVLLRDAIRPVEVKAGDGERAEAEMLELGAMPADLEKLAA